MFKKASKGFLLLFGAAFFLSHAYSQEAKNADQEKNETTQLRIQVTGGEQSTPVSGATVYIEWREADGPTHKQGVTNRQGFVGPYTVVRTKVFIQVTTDGDEWQNMGNDFDLKEQGETIKINLTKKGPV